MIAICRQAQKRNEHMSHETANRNYNNNKKHGYTTLTGRLIKPCFHSHLSYQHPYMRTDLFQRCLRFLFSEFHLEDEFCGCLCVIIRTGEVCISVFTVCDQMQSFNHIIHFVTEYFSESVDAFRLELFHTAQ